MKKIHSMMPAAAVIGLFAFLFASAFVSQRAFAVRSPQPPLHPKTYHSPSGEFSLFVNPSDRQGRGSAEYHLLKGNTEVWHGERPFTLCHVRLLDDGTAAGYGYTLGPEGWGGKSPDDYGDFITAILDPQGKVRLKRAVRRGYGRLVFEDQYPQPEAQGLVVDLENDRLIVLVADADINRQNTAWHQYRLSTGKSLGTIHPKQNMADPDQLCWCHEPRPIPGTPLTLVQWYRSEWEPHLKGTHFAVIDMQGRPVWQRTLRDDYTIPGDEEAEDRLFDWFAANSAILSVEAGGRFDVVFAKKGQRVSFAVRRDDAGAWAVTEIGRKPYHPPQEPTADQTAEVTEDELPEDAPPRVSLDYLGAIELRGGAADRLDKIAAATMDRHGRLHVLDEHTYCVHAFSPEGKPLFLCKPDPHDIPAGHVGFPNMTISDAGEIFVGRETGGYLRFSADGKYLGIARLDLDSITEEWHFQPGTGRRWVRCYEEIALVDAKDRVIKTIKRRPNGRWFDRPGALAVAPDGSMVVLDRAFFNFVADPSLNLYSADGTPVRTFPTPAVLGPHLKLAFSGEWIAAIGYDGPLALFDKTGKPLLDPEAGKRLTPNRKRFLFFSSDGKELRVLGAETRTMHRFAVPRAG